MRQNHLQEKTKYILPATLINSRVFQTNDPKKAFKLKTIKFANKPLMYSAMSAHLTSPQYHYYFPVWFTG